MLSDNSETKITTGVSGKNYINSSQLFGNLVCAYPFITDVFFVTLRLSQNFKFIISS